MIPADDPSLTIGWHAAERDGLSIWRWTTGSGELPWTTRSQPTLLTLYCSTLAEYPVYEHMPALDAFETSAPNMALHWDAPAGHRLFELGPDLDRVPAPVRQPAGIHWCVGMYSSGSTWIFNAIRSIGNTVFPHLNHPGVYAESTDALPAGWTEFNRLIVKSHHSDDNLTALLLEHAERIWIPIRDPRDSVASAATHIFPNFDAALDAVTRSALHCERFTGDPRSTVLRYEDGFIDDPATLDQIADSYCQALSPGDRDRLFQQSRRQAIETMIRQLGPADTIDDGFPGGRVHMETQWHTHHVNRTGEIGKWRRMLNPAQVNEIERRLGPWMDRFGYRS